MSISKTQIDRLGDRLRGDVYTEGDLRLLDEYRRSFGEAYESVIGTICRIGQAPTGRPAKSTLSIVEKLRRESVRLSQMQDIAGCRIVAANVVQQDCIVGSLKSAFHNVTIVDRRENPSYGYRAVHVIAEVSEKPIEIQVRSSLQHLWAELSEQSSDVLGPSIKYGGGPGKWRDRLMEISQVVAKCEEVEKMYLEMTTMPERDMKINKKRKKQLQMEISHMWNRMADLLLGSISYLDDLKRKKL